MPVTGEFLPVEDTLFARCLNMIAHSAHAIFVFHTSHLWWNFSWTVLVQYMESLFCYTGYITTSLWLSQLIWMSNC